MTMLGGRGARRSSADALVALAIDPAAFTERLADIKKAEDEIADTLATALETIKRADALSSDAAARDDASKKREAEVGEREVAVTLREKAVDQRESECGSRENASAAAEEKLAADREALDASHASRTAVLDAAHAERMARVEEDAKAAAAARSASETTLAEATALRDCYAAKVAKLVAFAREIATDVSPPA